MTPSRWRLDGARAVVTGGSKGIGLAVTRELLDLGAHVLVVARGQARLDPALEAAAKDARLHVVQADVATAAGRQRVPDRRWDQSRCCNWRAGGWDQARHAKFADSAAQPRFSPPPLKSGLVAKN